MSYRDDFILYISLLNNNVKTFSECFRTVAVHPAVTIKCLNFPELSYLVRFGKVC